MQRPQLNQMEKGDSGSPPEMEVILRHSNDIAEKYRKLVNLKERELKKKERKLENSKLSMQRMSQRIKELEQERALADREEQVEMSRI